MPSMLWDGSLETGHETVDRQHREIIELINEFVALQDADCDSALVAGVLVRLSDYVSTHFAEEERLMERYAYPEGLTSTHKQEHLRLSGQTRDLVLAHRMGESADACELIALMQQWLSEHIMQVDRQLVSHIRCSAKLGDS